MHLTDVEVALFVLPLVAVVDTVQHFLTRYLSRFMTIINFMATIRTFVGLLGNV